MMQFKFIPLMFHKSPQRCLKHRLSKTEIKHKHVNKYAHIGNSSGSSLSLGPGQLWLNLDPFRLLALPFGIAFHHQLVLLSYHTILLLPYHFLKLVSFLGANRTKSTSVGPWLLRGAIKIPEYNTIQYNTVFTWIEISSIVTSFANVNVTSPSINVAFFPLHDHYHHRHHQ